MDRSLIDLIAKFNEAQELAVEILESKFDCPRPQSAMEFTTRCVQAIRDKDYQSGGYIIRPHGIGMEIDLGKFKIDFDFGHNGEINGFDSWRLYNFSTENNIKTALNSEQKIEEAIEQAIIDGYIYKSNGMGSNHYVRS